MPSLIKLVQLTPNAAAPATPAVESSNDEQRLWLADANASLFSSWDHLEGEGSPAGAARDADGFPMPTSGGISVKVINHFGDEVMKVFRVE